MTQVAKITGDVLVDGTLTAKTLNIPAGTVGNAGVAAAAGIDATKLDHQHAIRYSQADGSDVVSAIVPIHICRAAVEIVDVEVVCIDAPSGGDKQFTVDLQVADQSTPAPASLLYAPVTIDSTVADCEVKSATITTTAAVADDTLLVVVTASGSTGTQGQGLIVVVTVREAAD